MAEAMGTKRHKAEDWTGDPFMHFSATKEELVVHARFSRIEGDLEQFIYTLRNAILLWTRRHPYAATPKEPVSGESLPSSSANVFRPNEMGAMRLPQTTTEQNELRKLAEKGPFEVYQWIYGSESLMAKAMKGSVWKQFGVETAAEGYQRVLQSIRSHQADLRAVRPQLQRVRWPRP